MLEDVQTLPKKIKSLVNGSLFLSDVPKQAMQVTNQNFILQLVDDIKSLIRKMKNIVDGSLFFDDVPQRKQKGKKKKLALIAVVTIFILTLAIILMVLFAELCPKSKFYKRQKEPGNY